MTHPLDALWHRIAARKGADPADSYTAQLLARGIGRAAQKLGEEAVETVIEAARLEAAWLEVGAGDAAKLAGESADLLYHLLVLWAAAGLTPEDVYAVLESRAGTGGLAEKAARKKE